MKWVLAFRVFCGLAVFVISALALWGWSDNMMPVTTVSFLLSSAFLVYPPRLKTIGKTFDGIIGLLGISAAGIGLFYLSRFLLQLNLLYVSATVANISLPASICLVLLGFGINFLTEEMPLPQLLFEKTLRHSLIRIYLFAYLLLVAGGSFFTLQTVHQLIVQFVPGEILPTLGSSILSHLIHYTFLLILVGIVFIVAVGIYLSRRVDRSVGELKALASQIEKGQLIEEDSVISENEWKELKDLKNFLLQVNRHLTEARHGLETKLLELENTTGELRNAQKIMVSLLEDTEESRRQLKEAKEQLEHLNLTLEVKVEERTRELKLAQGKLIRTGKMAALGQLASGIAHEIRNPLTGLTNSAYYLRLCEDEIKNEEIKKHVALITRQVSTVDQIVSNLLDFARVKEPEKKPTDIAKLIHETAERYPPPSGVRLSLKVPKQGSFSVLVDPIQIAQIFGNLMTNAYQAMTKGGELKIQTEDKIQTEEGQANDFIIIFQDTGVGIPPENLSKIFEPLFSTKPKGTGLGLAICRQLLEKHGGSLEVKSTYGKGSKFIVKLPVESKQTERGIS